MEAVRWQLAIDKYIKERGYGIGTLVAFSGEVNDKESGPDPFTENEQDAEPEPARAATSARRSTRDEYQILLVANKFQTGFDQPLLCGMYVDRRLAGIQAVQTLSRLNRAYPGKDTTYVLDFVNERRGDARRRSRPTTTTAELADVTDPNLVYDLRAKLDAAGYYDDFEVDRVVAVEMKPNAEAERTRRRRRAGRGPAPEAVQGGARAPERSRRSETTRRRRWKRPETSWTRSLLFKSDMGAFQRLYSFLSQIFDYGNTAIEKRFIFYRRLLRCWNSAASGKASTCRRSC